ncbi:MAG: hypothetical protein U0354_11335 [Candidatus Sericytochromatia bacterium]
MKKKLLSLSLLSIFMITSNSSFAKEIKNDVKTKNINSSNSEIKIGSTVDGKFVNSFEPKPIIGLKYTFYSYSSNPNYPMPPKEETTEVVSINNDYATLRLSGSFREESDKLVKMSDIRSSGVVYVKFKYEGLTDVKVPFKNFKNATKVSVSNKTNDLTLWLIKDIGVVKLTEYDKLSKNTIITVLKDFRYGNKLNINNKIY